MLKESCLGKKELTHQCAFSGAEMREECVEVMCVHR